MKDETLASMGKLLDKEMPRDAVHIACAPVIAAVPLNPGQHVGLLPDGAAALGAETIGIIDPYLRQTVRPGERCWLFLYPGSITSLKHLWTHPAFTADTTAPVDPKAASEKWLRDYAEHFDISYGRLMEAAAEWLNADEDNEWVVLNFDTPSEAYNEGAKEFWRHYEVMTGRTAKDTERTFFTCSC